MSGRLSAFLNPLATYIRLVYPDKGTHVTAKTLNPWTIGRALAAFILLFACLCLLAGTVTANDGSDVPARPKPDPQPQSSGEPANDPVAEPEDDAPPQRGRPDPQPTQDPEEFQPTELETPEAEKPDTDPPSELTIPDVEQADPIEIPEPILNTDLDDNGYTVLDPSKLDRRATDTDLVTLNFNEEKIESVLPYIVEWTGKTIMVRLTNLTGSKITLINDHPVSKHEALDLMFQAFRLSGVGIMETEKVIMIDLLEKTNLQKLQPGIVLGPDVNIMDYREDGNLVIKVYKLKHAKAGDIFERLNPSIPDYATFTDDANSNQLILEGDIGLAKRVQLLIDVLDVPPFIAVKTETFRLAYADASTIADIIVELFSSTPGSSSGSASSRRAPSQNRNSRSPQSQQQTLPQVGTSEQLQVSVLPQTNSVTIRTEPDILDDIRYLVENAWDIPPSKEGNIFRLYDLEYTDPVKVKNLLSALLETGGGSSSGARGGAGRAAAASGGADIAVADIFRIEAYPDSNRLIIISKTPDNFEWLDRMIDQIDQPLSVGMPVNVELKHASAIEVADIINALLAQSGGGGRGIQAPEEGLGGINFETSGTGDGSATEGGTEEITFPWQSGRGAGAEEAAEVSGLVGKSRVVPNPGQNSLLVLATPEIQSAVLEIISDLDRPGRQVMITAVLAEVKLGDALNLGIRVGTGITGSGDNTIQGRANLTLEKGGVGNAVENFASPWFQLSALDVGTTDVNFILQAIAQENETRILQRPRVFTSDNKEAVFFAGQDVTFQTGQTTADGGGTTSSFEQRAVGVGINVRPRITAERNVAMQIQVLLSNIDVAGGLINSNPVVDRREATTTITVKNNQTIVISGIRKEEETDVERKIPLLGDIPILGNIFTSTEKTKGVTELLIFITPVVVDNPDENDENYNARERERLEELSTPLDDLGKQLDKNSDFFDNLDSGQSSSTKKSQSGDRSSGTGKEG